MHHNQDVTFLCVKEQMESLHSDVLFLQKLLEDFCGNRSSTISLLRGRITDVAYQLEDIISCEITDKATCPIIFENDARLFSLRRKFSAFRSCIGEVSSIVEDAIEIKKILEMKKDIVGCDSWMASSSTGAPSRKSSTVGLGMDQVRIKENIWTQLGTSNYPDCWNGRDRQDYSCQECYHTQ